MTEEINFRSLLIPLHLTLPPSRIILITPLYFAIAHIHHFYEYTLTHQHAPLLPALLRTLFQFMYTTVFGWYATFVFLRTGSLPAVVLAHAFCNWCGVPRLWGRVERVEWSDGIKEEGDVGIGWSVAYYIILVAGLVGFQRWLRPLTESQGALVEI